MQIQIPHDVEALAIDRAAANGCTSVEHYVRNLILRDEVMYAAEGNLEDEDLARSLAMIDRSMEEAKNGGGRPADEVLHEIASRLNLKLNR